MIPTGLPVPLPQPPIARVLLATICLSSGPDDAQSYFSLGGTCCLVRATYDGWLQEDSGLHIDSSRPTSTRLTAILRYAAHVSHARSPCWPSRELASNTAVLTRCFHTAEFGHKGRCHRAERLDTLFFPRRALAQSANPTANRDWFLHTPTSDVLIRWASIRSDSPARYTNH
jgi:hypothetical protein